jgi:dihydroflavonol-4-reductase
MTILVTGAAGFIGSAVARALLSAGAAVRVFIRSKSDRRNLVDLRVEITFGDHRDRKSIDEAIKGCEAVIHVAADYRLWVPNPAEMFEANVTGTRNVMEAAGSVGVRKIIYTSSVATLGLPKETGVSDEDSSATPEEMIGTYKRSKFEAEHLVRTLISTHGLPAVIVHPSTPIGPRDRKPTPTGQIVVKAASGRMPAYVDTGLNVVHVDDVADGHLLALEKGAVGDHYILGGENLTLAQILEMVSTTTGRPAPRIRLPHDIVMPVAAAAELWARISKHEPFVTQDGVRLARKKMYFSSDRAKDKLGYRPRPAICAIADAVAWFDAHGYIH